MKVALIADIHSNMVALEVVLAEIERIQPDTVVCLGDAVSIGAQPHECLAALRKLGCLMVLGNADSWVLNPKPDPNANEDRRKVDEMDRWNADQLSDEDWSFLRSFERNVTVPLPGGEELLAYHGSPSDFTERITAKTPASTLDFHFRNRQPLVCAGGHTHIQLVRRYRSSYVLNPGSVGMAYDPYPPGEEAKNAPWAEFAVVEVTDGRVDLRLLRTPFDVKRWVSVLRDSGLPHADVLIDDYGNI